MSSDFSVFDAPSVPGVQPDLRPFRERRWPLSAADLAERRLRRAERRLRRALPPGPQGPKARRKELHRLTTSLAPVHFPLAVLLLFVVCFLPHKKGGDQHGAAPAAGTSA